MTDRERTAVAMTAGSSPIVAEAHRQSALIAASEHEAGDQGFVDAISMDWDDDAETAG